MRDDTSDDRMYTPWGGKEGGKLKRCRVTTRVQTRDDTSDDKMYTPYGGKEGRGRS